jgi:hypothetical protein
MAQGTRDPSALARAVIGWTYFWLAACVGTALTTIWELVLASRLASDTPSTWLEKPPELAAVDVPDGLAVLLYIVATLGSGFLTLKWIHRTSANAHARDGAMTISPGWSVGWFFIPIALLWKPFTGVRETWQVSHGEPLSLDAPTPAVLRSWWGWWVAVSIAGNIAARIEISSTTVGTMVLADGADLATTAMSVPLALALIAVVRQLTQAQVDQANAELIG